MQAFELVSLYAQHSVAALPWMAALALSFGLLYRFGTVQTPPPRALQRAMVLVAVGVGLALAWQRASLVDDAFITLRVVSHQLSGHGLVYNAGQSVLGITNLGWAMILTVLGGMGVSLPHAALFGSMASYVGIIAAILWASAGFDRPSPWPLAAVLFALQGTAISFATTGLETSAATLGVILGVGALLRREGSEGAVLAGLAFAFAAWIRLDHGLFWLAATLVLAVRDPRRVPALVAPGVLIIAEVLWCWITYGDPLPNTFYAKSVLGWYPSQGLWYVTIWWLGSHLVWTVPAVLVWIGTRSDDPREGDLAGILGVGAVLWHVYLLMIGGDFMHGRFLLPILGLWVLALERCVVRARRPWRIAALAAASIGGVALVPPGRIVHQIADEGTVYRLTSVFPIAVDHRSWHIGHATRSLLSEADPKPVLAAFGIGMVGYLNPDLEIVDLLGLTDRTIGRQPLHRRSRPGHEKQAPAGYLDARGVMLTQKAPDPEFEHLTEVRFHLGPHRLSLIHLHHWDRYLAAELRRGGAKIIDADRWVRRQQRLLVGEDPERIREVLDFLDRWYFPHASRPEVRKTLHRTVAPDLSLADRP